MVKRQKAPKAVAAPLPAAEPPPYVWSPSTRGFYHPDIHGAAIPADALPVTEDERRALLAGQSKGHEIAAGPKGRPVLRDRDPFQPPLHMRRREAYGEIQDQLLMLAGDLKRAGIDSDLVRHFDRVHAAHPKSAS